MTIDAPYAATPVVIDGKLDDPVWRQAACYPLSPMPGKKLAEKGLIRMAWDDQYVYLAAEFTDSDVIAEGVKDGQMHFDLGDVCELFLKPDHDPGYWELYVTPKGQQSAFYIPSRGRHVPSSFVSKPGALKVAAQIQGTLNEYHDRDQCWTAEMAVPWAMLMEKLPQNDARRFADIHWRMLVGRYNYSRYLSELELSSLPHISAVSYHLYEEYATLHLVRPPQRKPG